MTNQIISQKGLNLFIKTKEQLLILTKESPFANFVDYKAENGR